MVRLIVTANQNGKSAVGLDRQIPSNPFATVKGFDPAFVWGTAPTPSVPWDGRNVAAERWSMVPEIGATRLLMVTFPPDTVFTASDFDAAAAGQEYMARLPGLAERFEPENLGMHTTDTVDYGIVIEGKISLELDDRKTVNLTLGDIVVQNGTRHAWRNPGDAPARLVFVLIGARRLEA